MKCYFCGSEIIEEKIYRSTLCPSCSKELRICLNCKFYSPEAHWGCHETIPESVQDKERANFCDYFSPADSIKQIIKSKPKNSKNARSDFDKLFG